MQDNGDALHDEIFGDDNAPGRLPAGLPDGILAMLLGGSRNGGLPGFGTPITGDGVRFHDEPTIVLPRNMTFEAAMKTLEQLHDDAETPTTWNPRFDYRPDDGAHAVARVLQNLYGMALGASRTFSTPFGEHKMPSQTKTVQLSLTQSEQVPWGLITLPNMPNLEIVLCELHSHPEYGHVFDMHITGPKKYKAEVERIIAAVGKELETNSIYRGKALLGGHELAFFDTSWFDPAQIVFSDQAERDLRAKLWAVLRHPEAVRAQGVSLKRAVLLYGPFGTGKTSAGLITAQIAVENGWTFLSAKSGDSILDILATARLYQRAVVFFEDLDSEDSEDDLAALLEAFDGINAKNCELVVVMTTNKYDSIPKGMLRPGRLDTTIYIGELDRGGTERLIKAVVPSSQLGDGIDYDAVYAAAEGFLPAFVREVASSAVLYAIERRGGGSDFTLTTEDLVAAAGSIRPQFVAHQKAHEASTRTTIEDLVAQAVMKAVHGGVVVTDFGDRMKIDLDKDDTE